MANRVLFVSGRCPHSKKVLLGIQQHSFLKELFKIVNVDTQPFPNYIKTVPCILINNQVITGNTVFEYFGKLVEGKKGQESRESKDELNESDQGQCTINEDGELEGYCSGGIGSSGVEFSMITEENDDYTKKHYKMETNYDYLDGSPDSIHQQVQEMEKNDQQINQKNKQFDNDLERMQRERGEIQQGGGGRPPGPGMGGPGPQGGGMGGPGMGGSGPQGGGGGRISMSGPDERYQNLGR